MAQADEMGEGEGRDDGFVDCAEGMKKRGKKRQGEGSRSSLVKLKSAVFELSGDTKIIFLRCGISCDIRGNGW